MYRPYGSSSLLDVYGDGGPGLVIGQREESFQLGGCVVETEKRLPDLRKCVISTG